MPAIRIKFKKDEFPLELGAAETLDSLRSQIEALTAIPAPKQKLIYKGSILKNN